MDFAPVDKLMTQGVSDAFFPGGVLLIAKNSRVCFQKAYGVTDLLSNTPVRAQTIFDLASLTKPLATTMAVLILVNAQRISLNQEIGTIIKSLGATDKGKISIDSLLRHMSGFPAHIEFYHDIVKSKSDPRSFLRKQLAQTPLAYVPGTNQIYSDLGYMMLSWVIETVCGQRFDQFVQEQVFEPLKAENIFFVEHFNRQLFVQVKKKYQIAATRQCAWRRKLLTGEVDDDNAWAVGGIEGHAGLFGDALSVYVLCAEILNAVLNRKCRILNPLLFKKFISKKYGFNMVAGFDTPSKQDSSAGRFFSPQSIGHLGFTGTSFWIDPQKELTVVFLTNRVHPSKDNFKIKKFRPVLHDAICSIL